jgi:hypothetical protein
VDETGAFTVDGETSGSLAPDSSWTIPVTFLPDTYVDYSAAIEIISNDPELPAVSVPLTGEGVPQDTPDIEVSPMSVDFGVVTSVATQFVIIQNKGEADLSITGITQVGSGAFVLATDHSGSTVAPGDELPVLITYAPSSELGDTGTLTIESDDPDEPSVDVLLLGNGGGDYEYPVAVIDCPTSTDPPVWVQLDGSESYDPQGNEPLEYMWMITDTPDLSTAELNNATGSVVDLWADLAGEYEVQLTVMNTLGVISAPARCDLSAVPSDGIHVELLWNTANADFDLHLRQEGFELFAVPEDCSYCNPNPDWGASGGDDDPKIDLDDQSGYGPENIVIKTPANGDYRVAVHYFDDHGDNDVTATVRVWVDGVMDFEDTKVMQRDEVWDAAIIEWPDKTVIPLTGAPFDAPVRGCL